MARARVIEPASGLYKNGSRWWVRTVRAPIAGILRPLSTGTTDVARANAIKAMLDAFAQNPTQYEWLECAVSSDVSLDALFTHHAAGTLHLLREQLQVAKSAAKDADLEPLVQRWVDEHLDTLDSNDLTDESKGVYERQVRFFIPAGVPFPVSTFTEDVLKAKLATLTGARADKSAKVSGSTKRRYVAALRLFFKWARKRVTFPENPFQDSDWVPSNGSPRSVFHDYDTVQRVLEHLDGEDLVAMATIYGSGLELGGLLDQKTLHLGKMHRNIEDDERTMVVPGRASSISEDDRKNEHRSERTIFVDLWAWRLLREHARTRMPNAPLWSYNPATYGKDLRERFYWAQVKAGLIDAPEKNEKTGKYLWGRVRPHRLHDARHSYCQNRALGLDGEEPQDISFLANQLGHADEQMVMRIYKKANIKQRLALIQKQRAMRAAKAAGAK